MGNVFSKGGGGVKGYEYSFGIHMGLSLGPVDEIVEIKVGDRLVYPKAVDLDRTYDATLNLATSSLGGLYFPDPNVTATIDGVDCIAMALPFNGANPPWIPGDNLQLTNFRRLTGEGGQEPVDVSGIYRISIPQGVDTQYLSRIWIWVPVPMTVLFGAYQGAAEDPLSGQAVITAIDYTVPIPTPAEQLRLSVNRDVFIDAYDVFGGSDGEGGIWGWLSVMMGHPTQGCAWGLAQMLGGEPQPGFRNRCTVFFDGVISAMNPYPKPWAFRQRRTLAGWDGEVWQPELCKIVLTRGLGPMDETLSPEIHAMNPAHIIYECLTNRMWGRGLPAAAIDEASFLAAAQTLYAEGFGLCLRWSRTDEIGSFIKTVLEHIGGAVYQDRSSAKVALSLIRGDYDFDALRMFDVESGLLGITDSAVAAVPDLVNEIIVNFVDPLSGDEATVRAQNIASIQSSNGQFISLVKNYPGIPTNELARRVAQRDLRAYGYGLRRFTLECDRRAWNVVPGDVIKIQDEARGILPMAVRVGPVRYGNLADGKITIECAQDVFSFPASSFVDYQEPTWEPPNRLPCLGLHEAFEVPYFLLANALPASEFAQVTPGSSRAGLVVAQGQSLNLSYEIATRASASTPDDEPPTNGWQCGV